MIRIFLYCLFSTAITLPLLAQIPGIPSNLESSKNVTEDKSKIQAKEKLLAQRKIVLEQILADIEKLEEPEVRSSYLSSAGKHFCRDGDKRRAIELFEKSLSEYYFSKAKAEKTNDEKSTEIIYGGSSRIYIIQDVNSCDSELAYEYLLKTRPQKLSEILKTLYKNPNYSVLNPRVRGIISWEIIREENLKREIIRVKPARAEEFINRDLNTFISNQTLDSLDSLFRLNPSLANNLTEKVVEKLIRTQMFDPVDKKALILTYPNNFQTASTFLKALGSDSKNNWYRMEISDDSLVKLADKIAGDAVEAKFEWIYEDALKIIQRLLPDRYAQFEQMKADKLKTPEGIEAQNFRKLRQKDVPVERLLSDAENYSEKNQRKIYKIAACRLVAKENIKSATDVLNENFTDKENTDKRLSLIFYSFAIEFLESEKKDYIQAEKWIERIIDPQLRIDSLVFLAEILYRRDAVNNKEKALQLLSKALKEFNSKSQAVNQKEAFSDIIAGYSMIESETAFSMFEASLKPNDKNKVSAETLNKYNDVEDLRWVATFGADRNFGNETTVSNLQKISFEKTLNIINRQDSIRSKIYYKLKLLGSEFNDRFGLEEIESFCNP